MTRRPPKSTPFPTSTFFRSAKPLADYTIEDIRREYLTQKSCAPYCTISCVHQIAYLDRKSTRLHSSHQIISYAVFCFKIINFHHASITTTAVSLNIGNLAPN